MARQRQRPLKSRRLGPSPRIWLPFYLAGGVTSWASITDLPITEERPWTLFVPLAVAWIYAARPWRYVSQWAWEHENSGRPPRKRSMNSRLVGAYFNAAQGWQKQPPCPAEIRVRPPRGAGAGNQPRRADVIQFPETSRNGSVLESLIEEFSDLITRSDNPPDWREEQS